MSLERYILGLEAASEAPDKIHTFDTYIRAPKLYLEKHAAKVHDAIGSTYEERKKSLTPPSLQDLLFYAVSTGASLEKINILLKAGADFNCPQNNSCITVYDNIASHIENLVNQNSLKAVESLLKLDLEPVRSIFTKGNHIMNLAFSKDLRDMVLLLSNYKIETMTKEVLYGVVQRGNKEMIELLHQKGLIKTTINYILEHKDYRAARELVHLFKDHYDIADATLAIMLKDSRSSDLLPFLEYAKVPPERVINIAQSDGIDSFLQLPPILRFIQEHLDPDMITPQVKKMKLSPAEENTTEREDNNADDSTDNAQAQIILDMLQMSRLAFGQNNSIKDILDYINAFESLSPTGTMQTLIVLVISLDHNGILNAILNKMQVHKDKKVWKDFLNSQLSSLHINEQSMEIQDVLKTYLGNQTPYHNSARAEVVGQTQEDNPLAKFATAYRIDWNEVINIVQKRSKLPLDTSTKSVIKAAIDHSCLEVLDLILPKITKDLTYKAFAEWKDYISQLINAQNDKLNDILINHPELFEQKFGIIAALQTYYDNLSYIPAASDFVSAETKPTPLPAAATLWQIIEDVERESSCFRDSLGVILTPNLPQEGTSPLPQGVFGDYVTGDSDRVEEDHVSSQTNASEESSIIQQISNKRFDDAFLEICSLNSLNVIPIDLLVNLIMHYDNEEGRKTVKNIIIEKLPEEQKEKLEASYQGALKHALEQDVLMVVDDPSSGGSGGTTPVHVSGDDATDKTDYPI